GSAQVWLGNMSRGRKPKPWWDKSKQAYYVTVNKRRYRLGTKRPDGWPDAAWINFEVWSQKLGLGEVTCIPRPTYAATPKFVRACMPARGRHKLNFRRLQRVANKLMELYGPDERSLMDADVTDETDAEGEPIVRGLTCNIMQITRDLYDEDRQRTADLYPREE